MLCEVRGVLIINKKISSTKYFQALSSYERRVMTDKKKKAKPTSMKKTEDEDAPSPSKTDKTQLP